MKRPRFSDEFAMRDLAAAFPGIAISLDHLSRDEQVALFSGNAERIFRIGSATGST